MRDGTATCTSRTFSRSSGWVSQQPLEGQQPAGDALGVVEPVDAHQDADAAVAPERLRLGLDRGVVRQRLGTGSASIAHREDAEPHLAAGELHPVDVHGEAQDVGSAVAKWRR